MSKALIEVKKFGQCTRVFIDGKHAYDTAVVPKREIEKIISLLGLLGIENVEVKEAEK